MNQSVINNIVEIKENAAKVFLERDHPEITALEEHLNTSGAQQGEDDGPVLTQQQLAIKEEKEDEANK